MTIENEAELRDAYETIAKMYRLSERVAQDAIGDPETTEAVRDGIHAMIRKIERQIVAYLAKNPQHLEPTAKAA